jgi:hypothetical protein
MQDISILYRKIMRTGSMLSLLCLAAGLTIRVAVSQNGSQAWDWQSSYLYLMIGIFTMLFTPVIGLLTFFIYNVKNKQYPMAILVVMLLVLLIGGTWLIHPDK